RHTKDALTGLSLRQPFVDQLHTRVQGGRPLALALLDIVDFSRIENDRGWEVADSVLERLGLLLAHRFPSDVPRSRWGGRELGFALEDHPAIDARALVERLLDEMEDMAFRDRQGERFNVSVAAGVAAWPKDARDVDQLIGVADRRMRAARRGQVRIVDAD